MTSWRRERRPVAAVERLPAEELPARLRVDPGVQILDCRERSEWEAGHIPESANQPWHDIDRLPDDLDPHRPIAVICRSGPRAATAASLLQRHGAGHVIHVVDGGVPTWNRLGEPFATAAGRETAVV